MHETPKAVDWVDYCFEVYEQDGPTGFFREALEISVRDYGGNVLWRGKPGEEPQYRIPTQIVAESAGRLVAGGDVLCDYSTMAFYPGPAKLKKSSQGEL